MPGRVPLVRGGVMFEDWSVDLDQADDESPAQTPVSRDAKLLPVDWRLFDVLAAHRGRAGIYPAVPRLVDALKVSDSTVHRSLRRLAAAGLVERIPVFERDDDPEWQRRGHRTRHAKRQTSNSYRLASVTPGPGVTGSRETPAQTPVSPKSVTPHEGKEVVQPVSKGGLVEAPRAREPVAFSIEPPEAAMLDHPPDVGELLDVIGRSFGEVLILEGPATYRTARGRLLDLEDGPLEDFHRAVDQLDRDTCSHHGSPCQAGHRCLRHSRRNRARG